MRTFLTLLGILAVIGLASWAYQENHKTRLALKEVRDLQGLKPERPLRLLYKALKYYKGRHVATVSD